MCTRNKAKTSNLGLKRDYEVKNFFVGCIDCLRRARLAVSCLNAKLSYVTAAWNLILNVFIWIHIKNLKYNQQI